MDHAVIRKRNATVWFLLIVSVLYVVLFHSFAHATEQTFRIITEEFPPYNYTSKNGVVQGISTEIVRTILKRLGHPDNIELIPWTDGYRTIQEEDNIILFSTTRTPIREKLFKWVGPLVPNNSVFFARKNAGITIANMEDAKKVESIGVYKDDFAELLLKEKGFTNLEVELENRKNLLKLIDGQIDLWVANELTGKHMAAGSAAGDKIEKIFDIQKDYMFIAFSKSTPDSVVNEWQQILDDIKSDGTYAQIFSQWIMFSYTEDLKPQMRETVELTETERKWIEDHPVIRIAPDPDFAPFQFRDVGGQSTGIADDYLGLISRKLGIRFEYLKPQSWVESLAMVKNREADLVAVAAKTLDRETYMLFSMPYLEFPDVIITRRGTDRVNSFEELKGKTLASVEGFAINDYIRENHPDIRLTLKPDVKSALQGVSMGETDAAVLNIATTSHIIEKWNITNLRVDTLSGFSYQLSFGSRNDWPMLNRLLNKALAATSEEEKKGIFKRWVSISTDTEGAEPKLMLTEAERKWLAAHPVIRAGSDAKWPPVEYLDEDGIISGMAADFMALIEKRLDIEIQIMPESIWTEALAKIRKREFDVLPAAARTPEREPYLLFTKPYLELPAVIIVNNKTSGISKMADLRGKTVAVVKDYATHHFLRRGFPYLDLAIVPDTTTGLYDVSYGKVDALVANVAVASWYIEKNAIQNLRVVGESGFIFDLGIASRKDWPELNHILEKGLASITNEERQAIYRKWVGLKTQSWRPSREQIIAVVAILGVMIVATVLFLNVALKRKVDQKTAELEEALDLRKQSEEEARKARGVAEKASQTKSEFLATMSHEIRSPLNAVIGLTDLARKTTATTKQMEYLKMAQDSADTLLNLVNDILDLTKIEKGKMEMKKVVFDPVALARKTVEPLEFLATQKGLDFSIQIAPDVPRSVLGAADMLRQILTNLVGNAVKFTPEGYVKLSVALLDDAVDYQESGTVSVQFTVIDTGIGIPGEQQEKIFESFTQADSSTTRNFGGTGLGTTISRQLVELMGGNIQLSSEEGKGTSFTFSTPVEIIDTGSKEDAPDDFVDESVPRKYEALKILLVEDNLINSYLAVESLTMFGQEVITAVNGREGLNLLQQGEFDIVLMDIMMPEMDGYETTRRIRQREETEGGHIPIIALTASAFKEDVERCLAAGMDDYLSKPVNFDLLMEKISALTGISAIIEEDTTAPIAMVNEDEEALYDLSLLTEKVGNDKPKLKELLIWFIKDTSQQIEAAEEELTQGKTDQVVKSCHKIKGSAQSLLAESLRKAAEMAEAASKAGDINNSHQKLRSVKEIFDLICEKMGEKFDLKT